MRSTEALEIRYLKELKDVYYENGYEAGYDLGWSNGRIASIARLIQNTGQEIYARKFMDASDLELKLANERIAQERAEQLAQEQAVAEAEALKAGKKLRDWQWV